MVLMHLMTLCATYSTALVLNQGIWGQMEYGYLCEHRENDLLLIAGVIELVTQGMIDSENREWKDGAYFQWGKVTFGTRQASSVLFDY